MKQKATNKKVMMGMSAAAVLGLSGLATQVQADPISFMAPGGFTFKYQDYEFATAPAVNDNVGGLINVTNILNAKGQNEWIPFGSSSAISDGTELDGFFSNITITNFNTGSGNFTGTGGLMVLYDVPFNQFNPSLFPTLGINPAQEICGQTSGSGTTGCPTPWLTALFVPGYGWTALSGFDGTDSVLGNFTGTNPIGGTGNGYLSVGDVGGATITNGNGGANFALPGTYVGSVNAALDTNGNVFTGGPGTPPAPADMLFKSNFNQCGVPLAPSPGCDPTDNINTAWSNDPVTGRKIPEPGTLALLAVVCVAAGGLARRRRV